MKKTVEKEIYKINRWVKKETNGDVDILDFLFANSTVLRTDLQGDITFTITPDGDIEKSTQYTCFNNLLFYDPSDVELSSMEETIKNYKEQNS